MQDDLLADSSLVEQEQITEFLEVNESIDLGEIASFYEQRDNFIQLEEGVIIEEENLIDEGLMEANLIDISHEFSRNYLELNEEDLPIVQDVDAFTGVMLRRPLSIEDTLDKYSDVFSHALTHVKTPSFDEKASSEIHRRLIKFYDEYNDLLPNVLLSREAGKGSLQTYVLQSIKNHISVKDILESLTDFLNKNKILLSDNSRLHINASNEARVLEFLNKLKTFYNEDLENYKKNQNSNSIVQYTVVQQIDRLNIILHESKMNIVYPKKILLGSDEFICGSCNSTEEGNSLFMKAMIVNTSKEDDFIFIIPTFEVCTKCGSINTLPYNYFNIISNKLKEVLKAETNMKVIHERLQQLSEAFSFYPYQIPKTGIFKVLPPDLLAYFEDNYTHFGEALDSKEIEPFNFQESVKEYKQRVSRLMIFNDISMYNTQYDKTLFSIDHKIDDSLVASTYSVMAKIFCMVVGVDYREAKVNAVDSLLFYLEDFVPFVSNSFSVMECYALNLVGLASNTTYERMQSEYNTIISYLEKYKDYLVFIPITKSTFSNENLEQYFFDDCMQRLIDYITDGMIILSLKEELVSLCVVGIKSPFLINKGQLKSILMSKEKDRNTLIKKFSDSLSSISDDYITQLFTTKKHWLYNKWLLTEKCTDIFKAFSSKDIYTLTKLVFSNIRLFPELAQSLLTYKDEVEFVSRLEFYYGGLFPNEDFTQYSNEDLPVFFVIDKKQSETFNDYINAVRSKQSTRIKNGIIKYDAWFRENINAFFSVLSDYILSTTDEIDVLFMDIMKNIAVYSKFVIAKAFSISENMMKFALISTNFFEFPKADKKLELAKQILYAFPYKDSSLQLMLSEGDDDPDIVIPLLLTEKDILLEEFKNCSFYVKELLQSEFNLFFEKVEE